MEKNDTAIYRVADSQADLNIGDESGNVLVEFKDGHVRTKEFDSRTIDKYLETRGDSSQADLNIGDEDGNVLVEFKDGHIRTKYFDSRNAGDSLTSEEREMLDEARTKIVNLNKDSKYLNFAFITDTHAEGLYQPTIRIATDSLRLFKALCNERFVDFAVHGGDIITDYCTTREDTIKAFDSVTSYTGEIMCPVFFTKGNHDGNGKCFPRADMDNLDWTHNTYYVAYASGDVIGLKAVTQSTWDGVSELFTSNVADITEILTNQQFFMLTQNAIDVVHDENNKFSGYFYKDYDDYGIRIIVINAYEVPTEQSGTGNTNYDGAGVSSAQKAWLNTALNTDKKVIVFGHTPNPTGLTSYLQNKSNLIAYIHGHEHQDSYVTNNGFRNIGVINAFGTSKLTRYYAFSVFTVDTENGILYETRIGTGSDRMFNFLNS